MTELWYVEFLFRDASNYLRFVEVYKEHTFRGLLSREIENF